MLLASFMLSGFLIVAGTLLMVWGGRGRLLDHEPRCRKCAYSLRGLESPTVCPECGASLGAKRGVVMGARKKRPWATALGLVLLALSLLPVRAVWELQTGGLNPRLPTSVLIQNARRDEYFSPGPIDELSVRLAAGKISAADAEAVLRGGLSMWPEDAGGDWAAFVDQAWGAGLLSRQALSELVQQAPYLLCIGPDREVQNLTIRIVVGPRLLTDGMRRTGPPPRIRMTGALVEARLNGEPITFFEPDDPRRVLSGHGYEFELPANYAGRKLELVTEYSLTDGLTGDTLVPQSRARATLHLTGLVVGESTSVRLDGITTLQTNRPSRQNDSRAPIAP